MPSEAEMVSVNVLFFGQLRQVTNTRQEIISLERDTKLADLVARLNEEYGPSFGAEMTYIRGLRILVDGREYGLLEEVQAPLPDGCTVVFLPPVAGG